jgi:hypothetical protein
MYRSSDKEKRREEMRRDEKRKEEKRKKRRHFVDVKFSL